MLDFLVSYLVPSWVYNISTHIDYEGQRRAEQIFQTILIAFGMIGFIAGYWVQQLSITMYIIGVGFVISCLAVLPPWPMYRRNPLNWQPNPIRDTDDDDKSKQPPSSAASTASSSGSTGKNTKKSR